MRASVTRKIEHVADFGAKRRILAALVALYF